MRRIKKFEAPLCHTYWLNVSALTPNILYKDMETHHNHFLKKMFLREQGFLCAYTGQEIDFDNCHIEHIKPQKVCIRERGKNKEPREDVDCKNMIACFPSGSKTKSCKYGAILNHGDTWHSGSFVSPLDLDCESKFTFLITGKVEATNADSKAQATISRLNLNEGELLDLRKDAILGILGMKPGMTPITSEEAQIILEDIEKPINGKLPAFVFALKQALGEYVL